MSSWLDDAPIVFAAIAAIGYVLVVVQAMLFEHSVIALVIIVGLVFTAQSVVLYFAVKRKRSH